MRERRLQWLLALAALVVLCNLSNPLGLHQNDEDYYFNVARDMARHGTWIVPTWFGAPTFVKPPLLYWMMHLAISVLGPSYFAARLPVALCAVACVWMTWRLGLALFEDEAVAAGAAAMLTGSFGFFQYGRVGMMDVPFTLCWLIVVWGMWATRLADAPAAMYACAVATAAAVLLKGPIGVIVPLGALLLWCATGQRPRWRADAVVLFVVLIALWPLLLATHGLAGTAWHEFIIVENGGKFIGGRNPVSGMLSGFAVLAMPWTPLFLVALARVLCGGRWRQPTPALLLSFVVVNVAAYALPAIKWAQYLLPSLPLLCLLTAWQLRETCQGTDGPGGWGIAFKVAAALTALGLFVAAALLAVGVFVLPVPDLRVGLFALAVALAITALGLVNGPDLVWAGGGAAAALVVLAFLAPPLSMDRLPPNLAAVTADRPLRVYGAPPYRYAVALDRDVLPAAGPQQFKAEFEQGDRFIVGESEMNELLGEHVLLETQASMDLCWRKWRRNMTWSDIGKALKAGDLAPMTENICVLEKRR